MPNVDRQPAKRITCEHSFIKLIIQSICQLCASDSSSDIWHVNIILFILSCHIDKMSSRLIWIFMQPTVLSPFEATKMTEQLLRLHITLNVSANSLAAAP